MHNLRIPYSFHALQRTTSSVRCVIANALFSSCAGSSRFLVVYYVNSIGYFILIGMFLNLFCKLKNREQQEKMPFIISTWHLSATTVEVNAPLAWLKCSSSF